SDLRPVERARPMNDAGGQRILEAGVVAEINEGQGVHIRQPRFPVVRVTREYAALARGEALIDERPGAHRLRRVETGGRDVQVVPECGKLLGKAGERFRHLHLNGELVDCLRILEVDRAEAELPGEIVVVNPLEREDDVVGGEVLAVMPGDAGPEAD